MVSTLVCNLSRVLASGDVLDDVVFLSDLCQVPLNLVQLFEHRPYLQ